MKPASQSIHESFLERLLAAPFGKFTQVRKELVRELRTRDERAAAAELAATKRPTRSAWALNQLARSHPRELAAFVAVAQRVREAQKRAVSARDASGMREAGREMNASASSLAKLAARAIEQEGRSASPAIERAILGTLRAVPFLSDEDLQRLTRGALVADLEPPDDLAILGTVSTGCARPVHEHGAVKERESAADRRREREEERRLRAEEALRARQIEKLEGAAAEAEREAARRERAAEAAATRARALTDDAREARAEAVRARAAVEAARRR